MARRTKTLASSAGMAAVMTMLLSGCLAVPPDSQLEAWNAAVMEGVPNALDAQATASNDSTEGFGYELFLNVTLRDTLNPTYDDVKKTYEALVTSTEEKWHDWYIHVSFSNAGDPYHKLSMEETLANTGITERSCEEWSVCVRSRGTSLSVSLDPNDAGLPPIPRAPVAGVKVTINDAEQVQAWVDAIEASDPGVESVEVGVVSGDATLEFDEDSFMKEFLELDKDMFVDDKGFLYFDVNLRDDATLTYSVMENNYDALSASTQEQFRGKKVALYFHPAGVGGWLRVDEALEKAGVSHPFTETVSGFAFSLSIYLTPDGGDFPRPDGTGFTPSEVG